MNTFHIDEAEKDDNIDVLDLLLPDKDSKIRVMQASIEERKTLHKWLKHNLIPSAGLVVDFYPTHTVFVMPCYECDYKKVHLDKYHYGYMKNNQDEYRSGECPECGTYMTYECNFDDGAHRETLRNAIGIGNYFKSYYRQDLEAYNQIVDDSEIKVLLRGKTIYEINNPAKSLNRTKLGEYISDVLKSK